ncbi:MAG TPA: glycosyltransferase family 39 protein [Pyrinomonadaceae bacterium]|nr:glycosyltransferase family 39 protein [Pyrinomonadaceae bacterium]
MSPSIAPVLTAGIKSRLFPDQIARTSRRRVIFTALAGIVLAGFGFRVFQLGAEGLSEDELNKVRAVAEYRARGLTPANGEHPFLMKGLIAVSSVAADGWNAFAAPTNNGLHISTEAATRFPGALLGALTSLLIFLVVRELFGVETGLLAAAMWAFDPQAIGFNRIAKEDSFFLFFFLLANVFWLRGQSVAETSVGKSHERYYWLTAAAFGAMMASKYLPHVMAISAAYYHIFLDIPTTRWRVGKLRWLIFFAVLGAVFLLCNPTILLPGTWHEMRIFAGEKRIGHDSYEFIGNLYRNKVTLWLNGSPWYFYYVFLGVKLPLPLVAAFLAGLPMLFTKRLGDGRFFVLSWFFFWFFPFSVMGGKFTRYFTFALPVVIITAAIGVYAVGQYLSRQMSRDASVESGADSFVRVALGLSVVAFSAYASARAAPHYRLYTNALGGGTERAGSYFPHDEFYDSSVRDAANIIAREAPRGARVASETPGLFSYYATRGGRDDFLSASLSDSQALGELAVGDFVIVARGRRYFSNEAVTGALRTAGTPAFSIELGTIPSMEVYQLDERSHATMMRAIDRQKSGDQ